MCEFVLKKQGVNYVEKVCQKHSDLHRPGIKNPTRSVAANRLRSMLFDQMRNTAAAKQKNQRLEDLMLFDPRKIRKKYWGGGHQDSLCTIEANGKKSLQFLQSSRIVKCCFRFKKRRQMFKV